MNRFDERSELGGDASVDLDRVDAPGCGNEELDVEEARVEPVRSDEPLGQPVELTSRRAGLSADGYSKRSNELVPSYFPESVAPITVVRPWWT